MGIGRATIAAAVIGIVAAAGGATPVRAASPTSQTKPYIAVGGDVFESGPIVLDDPVTTATASTCEYDDPSTGGTCFAFDAGDFALVSITINDDNFARVGGSYQFADADGNSVGTAAFFCNSIDDVFLPATAVTMTVFVQQATSSTILGCGPSPEPGINGLTGNPQPSTGTTGTIKIDLS